jgi:hypothetical protein
MSGKMPPSNGLKVGRRSFRNRRVNEKIRRERMALP